MPWQTLPPLIIICGAFTITGLGLRGLDHLFLGRNRRVRTSEFEFQLDQRTLFIRAAAKEKTAKEAKEAEEKEKLQKKLALSSS